MTDQEMERRFIWGGAVSYQEHLYAVVAINSINHTYTLERLSDGLTVANIKASEVTRQ